jgi:hypothetical protein
MRWHLCAREIMWDFNVKEQLYGNECKVQLQCVFSICIVRVYQYKNELMRPPALLVKPGKTDVRGYGVRSTTLALGKTSNSKCMIALKASRRRKWELEWVGRCYAGWIEFYLYLDLFLPLYDFEPISAPSCTFGKTW